MPSGHLMKDSYTRQFRPLHVPFGKKTNCFSTIIGKEEKLPFISNGMQYLQNI
jgi:hypothetical protein